MFYPPKSFMTEDIVKSVARQHANAVLPFMSMMLLSQDDQVTYLNTMLDTLEDKVEELTRRGSSRREMRGRDNGGDGKRERSDSDEYEDDRPRNRDKDKHRRA